MRKLTIQELNRISVQEFKDSGKTPVVVVLDNVRSLFNVGSIFRTADAFRVEAVYLCGLTGTPPHKEIHKSALGAEESVAWEYYPSTLDAVKILKEKGYLVLSVEQAEGAVWLNEFQPMSGKGYALVFGNEVRGVDDLVIQESDACIEIPQFGTKHSFNVAVTSGIVLWEIQKKLKDIKKAG